MNLRVRLVVALLALLAIGLVLFGAATSLLSDQAQRDRLDDQVRDAIPSATQQLRFAAGLGPDGGFGPPHSPSDEAEGGSSAPGRRDGGRAPSSALAPGSYLQLRDRGGVVLSTLQVSGEASSAKPQLPLGLDAPPHTVRLLEVGSVGGRVGRWRAAVSQNDRNGEVTVVAVPLTEVDAARTRLILLEGFGGFILLAVLGGGSWLILRRGLRPLEEMAETAGGITAGDLSTRVSPADGRSEVGQLGLALNTMLGEIEQAFLERDETERRLRQFLADASHELRTPLTSIQGFAEMFRLGADSEHVDRDVIMRRIEEESARMRTLVEDLLLLARLDQTRPAERTPVDLSVLAADACSDAVASAPGRPVSLDAPEPVVVLGDRDHLRQAVANLVANAVRHTPEGGAIELRSHLVDGRARLEVRDHGPGLSEDALAHVFDRFWQADAARVGHGAGLGLAIVAGIAHEHAGSATATNADGGGARFTIELPVAR